MSDKKRKEIDQISLNLHLREHSDEWLHDEILKKKYWALLITLIILLTNTIYIVRTYASGDGGEVANNDPQNATQPDEVQSGTLILVTAFSLFVMIVCLVYIFKKSRGDKTFYSELKAEKEAQLERKRAESVGKSQDDASNNNPYLQDNQYIPKYKQDQQNENKQKDSKIQSGQKSLRWFGSLSEYSSDFDEMPLNYGLRRVRLLNLAYLIFQVFLTLNQLARIISMSQNPEQESLLILGETEVHKVLYISSKLLYQIMISKALAVNWRYQMVLYTISALFIITNVNKNHYQVLYELIAQSLIFLIFICFQSWMDERQTKQQFLFKKHMEQINREKNSIVDNLPDGAIIFKDQSLFDKEAKNCPSMDDILQEIPQIEKKKKIIIRYINKTFQNMFNISDKQKVGNDMLMDEAKKKREQLDKSLRRQEIDDFSQQKSKRYVSEKSYYSADEENVSQTLGQQQHINIETGKKYESEKTNQENKLKLIENAEENCKEFDCKSEQLDPEFKQIISDVSINQRNKNQQSSKQNDKRQQQSFLQDMESFHNIDFDEKDNVEDDQTQKIISKIFKEIRLRKTDYIINGKSVQQNNEKKRKDHSFMTLLGNMKNGQVYEYLTPFQIEREQYLQQQQNEKNKKNVELKLENDPNNPNDYYQSQDRNLMNEKSKSSVFVSNTMTSVINYQDNLIEEEKEKEREREKELLEKKIPDFLHSRKEQIKHNLLNQISQTTQTVIDFNTAHKEQDDTQLIIQIISQQIKYDQEDATIIYFKDVTFGVMFEQIKAQKQFQEIINATISHEMRNPLNSIISNCFLLEEDDSLGKYVKMRLKTMRISCNLLTSFLHDLIDWTQIKLDRFNKKAESFDLKSTFEDITEMMRFKAELKNIYCKTEFDPNLPKKVIGDNQRLMQVLINLISNALKFTFMGGVLIKVKYEYDHKKLFVEIIDTGEGIKKENQKKMFKLFQTFGGKAQKNITGIGLGLCICKAIIEQFNGAIGFYSEEKKGTTFMFSFELDVLLKEDDDIQSEDEYVNQDLDHDDNESQDPELQVYQSFRQRAKIKSFIFLDSVVEKPILNHLKKYNSQRRSECQSQSSINSFKSRNMMNSVNSLVKSLEDKGIRPRDQDFMNFKGAFGVNNIQTNQFGQKKPQMELERIIEQDVEQIATQFEIKAIKSILEPIQSQRNKLIAIDEDEEEVEELMNFMDDEELDTEVENFSNEENQNYHPLLNNNVQNQYNETMQQSTVWNDDSNQEDQPILKVQEKEQIVNILSINDFIQKSSEKQQIENVNHTGILMKELVHDYSQKKEEIYVSDYTFSQKNSNEDISNQEGISNQTYSIHSSKENQLVNGKSEINFTNMIKDSNNPEKHINLTQSQNQGNITNNINIMFENATIINQKTNKYNRQIHSSIQKNNEIVKNSDTHQINKQIELVQSKLNKKNKTVADIKDKLTPKRLVSKDLREESLSMYQNLVNPLILLVEDDPFQLNAINDIITYHIKLKCDMSSNGQLGLKRYKDRLSKYKQYLDRSYKNFMNFLKSADYTELNFALKSEGESNFQKSNGSILNNNLVRSPGQGESSMNHIIKMNSYDILQNNKIDSKAEIQNDVEYPYYIIITDCNMPVMDGLEMGFEIKRNFEEFILYYVKKRQSYIDQHYKNYLENQQKQDVQNSLQDIKEVNQIYSWGQDPLPHKNQRSPLFDNSGKRNSNNSDPANNKNHAQLQEIKKQYQLVSQIFEKAQSKYKPFIILVSAYQGDKFMSKAKSYKINEVMHKPIQVKLLKKILQKVIPIP